MTEKPVPSYFEVVRKLQYPSGTVYVEGYNKIHHPTGMVRAFIKKEGGIELCEVPVNRTLRRVSFKKGEQNDVQRRVE